MRLSNMREAGLLLIIALLCVAMSFASPHFLTWDNIRAMLLSFSIEGIVVVGMTVLMIVGGIDATADALAAMSAGDLDVTVFQNATRQGEVALETALTMAKGEKAEANIWVPFEPVTPENMQKYK